MKILAFFTSSGSPYEGLTPTIRIRDLSDYSIVVNNASMSEVGDGHYVYDFASYDKDKEYAIRCDGGNSLNDVDRYVYAGNENYIDDIDETISENTEITNISTKIDSLSASNQSNFDVVNNNISEVNTNVLSLSGSLSGSSFTVQDIVNGVWDEPLTGATHNVPRSAGRRLRQLSDVVITDGTAQGNGNGYNQIELNGDAFTIDGAYDPALIAIVAGTGAGQCRNILEYDGTTRTATVDRNWKTQPDNTSEYIIYANAGREHVNEGLLTGSTINTATLNKYASSADNAYVGQLIFIRSGYGDDQVRLVESYNGITKIATIHCPWSRIPNTTSAYVMLPAHVHLLDKIANSVWTHQVSAGAPGAAEDYLVNIDTKVDGISLSGGSTPQQIAQAVWSESPSGYSGINTFGGLVNNMSEDIKRLLGLTHENIFIDNPTYDADGNMTGARLRIYSNPASVGTSSNVIGTYQISAPSNAPGQFISWQQVRTS